MVEDAKPDAGGTVGGARVAYPVEVAGTLHGAVVLDIAPRPAAELQRALRLIHWGTAWLIDLFRQRDFEQRQATIDRLALATELIATSVQEGHFRSAVLAVVNDIARRLECERVSVGMDRGGHCRVLAISHSATFDAKSQLAQRVGEAMDEVLDLGAAIVFPAPEDEALLGASHAILAKESADVAVVSVPLSANGSDWGVLTLERTQGTPFDPPTIELVRTMGLLLGPVLQLKRDNERGFLRAYQQALATRDRASMNIVGAQVNQAEAQVQLITEKLTRAHITAPFDGVVVTGDLSQLLGTPVEQGKLLFEIAPLDAYRVVLKVDERDVSYVALGQDGELALSGIPGARLPFSVARITPVSSPDEGRNFFRVEARMQSSVERLRPGMEGVGKIYIGERRLIWIWTHGLIDWVRLAFWTWLP